MKYKRLEATIYGRVQGVGFRYFVEVKAEENNIKGWVANQWDGTVKVVAEGREEDMELFLKALWQGPRLAYVEDVRYSITDIENVSFTSFDIRFGE
ncbi:MAG: acylphosphatase [Brevinematales bacterium]|nr:acylphosphatase [Brevinematales bacterium]